MRAFEVAVVVVLGLLAAAQPSMQLNFKHPLQSIIRRINQGGPYIGLVLETDSNEKALNDSELFIPSDEYPTVSLVGRTFHIGKIKGVDVIHVKTGAGSIATASTVQLLANNFAVEGIVHYGTVGTVNDSLSIGDVVIPAQTAYMGKWIWKKYKSRGVLTFGDFNLPEPGKNSLGSIDLKPTKFFNSSSGKTTYVFWLSITSSWIEIAEQLQDVELEQCISAEKCLPSEPQIVSGVRSGTGDIYVQNAALREFIYNQFKASVVDEGTAVVVWVALTNNLPVVVFRGVSNTAGGPTAYKSYGYLGSVNAFNAAASFIEAIGNSTSSRSGWPAAY